MTRISYVRVIQSAPQLRGFFVLWSLFSYTSFMTKAEFQKKALARIREELEKGAVPFERVRAFAAATLDLGLLHEGEVPNDAASALLRAFPEFTF